MRRRSDPHPLPTDTEPTNQTTEAASEQPEPANRTQARRARRRRTQRKKTPGYKVRVQALKAQLQDLLGRLDDSRLKRILLACGIAAVLVVAIIALIKSIPVGMAILAILGLAVVVRFLEELRHLPIL